MQGEVIDLGTFYADPTDHQLNLKLKKLLEALQSDDLTYMPFERAR